MIHTEDTGKVVDREKRSEFSADIRYALVDVEVALKDHKIHDIGALRYDGATFHDTSKKELFDSPLCELLKDADILARFLENPDKPPTGIRRQRLIDALADIQT